MDSAAALRSVLPAGASPVCTPEDPRGELSFVRSNGTIGQVATMSSSNKSDAQIRKEAEQVKHQLLCDRNPIACSQDHIPFEKFKGEIFMNAQAGPFSIEGTTTADGVETWKTSVTKPESPSAEMGFRRKVDPDAVDKINKKLAWVGLHIKPKGKISIIGVGFVRYQAGDGPGQPGTLESGVQLPPSGSSGSLGLGLGAAK
jgi:hypothetical protein